MDIDVSLGNENAVRACIAHLRRMAEDMLATAAMLQNGLETVPKPPSAAPALPDSLEGPHGA